MLHFFFFVVVAVFYWHNRKGSMREGLVLWVVRYGEGHGVRAMSVDAVAPIHKHVAQSVVFCVVDGNTATGVKSNMGRICLLTLNVPSSSSECTRMLL